MAARNECNILSFREHETDKAYVFGGVSYIAIKAMRKEFFSGFFDFAKDGTVFFPNSKIIRKKFGISVHPVISRKKYGTKSGTRMY